MCYWRLYCFFLISFDYDQLFEYDVNIDYCLMVFIEIWLYSFVIFSEFEEFCDYISFVINFVKNNIYNVLYFVFFFGKVNKGYERK